MYAIVDVHGRVIRVDDDFADLMDEAQSSGGPVIGFESEPEMRQNPPISPQSALRSSGLSKLNWDDVMAITPKEAQLALQPFFQIRRWEDSKEFHKRFGADEFYWPPSPQANQPALMAESLIGSNYKLSKSSKENREKYEKIVPRLPKNIKARVLKADVWGLNLVPAFQPVDLVTYMDENVDGNGEKLSNHTLTQIGRKTAEAYAAFKPAVDDDDDLEQISRKMKVNLCVGSSAECRNACLVYAGQNGAAFHNTASKLARTHALLAKPEHFMRMLVVAVDKFQRRARSAGSTPYFRMNVLSDIPWELVLPEFFDHFSQIQFYDYTKVPGRTDLPENYDLTFSYSGINLDAVRQEQRAFQRRAAFVFLFEDVGQKEAIDYDMPRSFLGLPVVDGDLYDIRSLDPENVIVGLRWKIPMGQEIDPRTKKMKFVIQCDLVDGKIVVAKTPRNQLFEEDAP